MKNIIDRIKHRANKKGGEDDKEVLMEIHYELLDEFFDSNITFNHVASKIESFSHLLKTPFKKDYLKLLSLCEMYNNSINENFPQKE